MGAIAVFLSRNGPPDPAIVRRMLAAAPHRGHQQTAEVLGQVAMGVCNDPDWVTATIARSEGHLVAFSGALDNDADLRAGLFRGVGGAPSRLDRPRRNTLLAAFERWGEGAIARLRGSFAGAVTDGRTLRCFRDQFGSRPLFYHDDSRGCFAATEVKQVLAGAGISREPDLDHLHGILFGGIERSTAYQGVERIPKWTVATAGPEPGLGWREYWDPGASVETSTLSLDEAIEGTREALDTAVRRVLTGRDAILLSGGLDSPALAAFAAVPLLTNPVQALTAIYPDYPSADESEWTRMAANHLGMPLHTFVADAGSLDEVERWVTLLDGPVDVLAIPESAESYSEARGLGARMVMNGEIAEMLFECRAYLLDHLLSHGRLRAAVRELSGRRELGRSTRKIARQVVRAIEPVLLINAVRKAKTDAALPPWVDVGRFAQDQADLFRV